MHGDLSRREFLAGAAGALAAGTVAKLAAAASPKKRPLDRAAGRPNILWIISEDTGPEFGCYGYGLVHTPNVDRLAREGALFTHAFTSGPVCSASRSGFMTGMYQTTIGAHHHRSHRGDGFELPEGVHVFTKYLRDAGYLTCIPAGRKTDWNFTPRVKPYDSNRWEDLKGKQPFFAQVQFSETHRKFKHCKEHPVDPDKVKLPPYYPDHPVARQDWALYLETINVLDQKIGQYLKRLDDDGLAENTIVFYFADHGRAHVRGKQWLYDGGIHIPLVIRWPGQIKPGTVTDELVSAIDFAPTCLKLAGVEPPKHMEGRVFLGPGRDQPRECIIAARDRCDETVDRIRCVRDKQYKYIRNFMPERPYTQPNAYKERSYPMLNLMKQLHAEGKLTPVQQLFMAERRPEEELYDCQADPWEVKNLAASPKHQDVLKRMRQRLEAWIRQTGDQGQFPEKPQARTPAKGQKRKAKQGAAAPGPEG
jgi:arylsulfatase A-like enzyme